VKLDARHAAAALVAAAALHAAVALATGHSARAEALPDLAPAAADLAIDPLKAAALVLRDGALVVDVGPADAFARWHVPGALSLPDASPGELAARVAGRPLVVYAPKDDLARAKVAAIRAAAPQARAWALAEGARGWYVAFELPTPLFADAPPPEGWAAAREAVRAALDAPRAPADGAVAALGTLARLGYRPALLEARRKPAAGGAKKKLAGGCG
jgi:rhodanese-related sulfurtransferase